MAYYSPSKIYGAQAPGAADQTPHQASTLGAVAASGFPNSFEFASPGENVAASWTSQQVNVSDLPDLTQPNSYDDPWNPLRTRGERTHSCGAKMMQASIYMPSTALSECGTMLSRHAHSDSAYVSGASGTRLSNNPINSTRSRAGRAAERAVPETRLPFACNWKDCKKSFKCKSDHRSVRHLLAECAESK
jgi:hypothetical protein